MKFSFNEQVDMLLVNGKIRQKFSESGSTIHWMLSGSYPSLALYILTDTWKIKRYWNLKTILRKCVKETKSVHSD